MINQYTEDKNIKILAVGDIMLGISSLRAIAEKDTIPDLLIKDSDSIIREIKPYIKNKDVLFGNLECVVSKEFNGVDFNNPQLLMAPLEAVSLLEFGNFDILNLANNHILDYGKENVRETVNLLEEKNFKIIGAPYTKYESKLQIFDIKDKKIGIIGYNLCNGGKKSEVSDILHSINIFEKLVDILIVSLHWGWNYEHNSKPSPEQIELGHTLIDKGVDIVLGHHSHVFQPVEFYHGKIIAYSLGNFIFDMWRDENKRTGIIEILINPNNEISVKIIPLVQVHYKLNIMSKDKNNMNHLIVKNIKDIPNSNRYKKEANKIRKKHNKEIIYYYILNFYKFSLAFHKTAMLRWFKKLFMRTFDFKVEFQGGKK